MDDNIKRKSFVFNVEWQEILLAYPAEVRLEVYDAIIEYVASGTLSELKPMAKMAFSFIKKEIDYNNVRYNNIVERNRINGSKGGNPNFKKGQPNPYYNGVDYTTKDNQTLPKITQDNPINDNDNDNKESLSNERPKKDELSFPPPKTEKIDFVGIMEEFNSTFTGKLQGVRSITEARKAAIRARIAQYGKDSIHTVFSIVLQSTFLLGANDRNWRAGFDWIFKQANYTKILEGNYNGNSTKNRGNPTTSKQEANEYALERMRQHKRELESGMADAMEDPF